MDRRIAEANGADKPRLLSASGRCHTAHPYVGRHVHTARDGGQHAPRPLVAAHYGSSLVPHRTAANHADGADRPARSRTVGSRGRPAAIRTVRRSMRHVLIIFTT